MSDLGQPHALLSSDLPDPRPDVRLRNAIASVLEVHQVEWVTDNSDTFWECGCNEDGRLSDGDEYDISSALDLFRHQADAVLAALLASALGVQP